MYKFIDNNGTFVVEGPNNQSYFSLSDKDGELLSSISANLSGDIKKDNDHFLTPPASIEDLRSNLLCRREFFIKVNNESIRLSYPHNDRLEAGLFYHKLIKQVKNLHIEILNFIPYDIPVEVMWIKLIHKGRGPVTITPTSFIPLYGRQEKNLRDHRGVSALLNRIELNRFGIFLKPTMLFDEKGHSENKTIYYVLGYEENGIPPQGQFPTLDFFYGYGDIVSPDAIEKNTKPAKTKQLEFDGKEACAALRFRQRKLRSNQEVNYVLIMGIEDKQQKAQSNFLKLNSLKKVTHKLLETKRYWLNYLSTLQLDFKDNDFNNWLLWVRLQPTLRKLFGCSFLPHFDYGKGGRGWRDLWQDSLAFLLSEPQKTKNLIVNNFRGVRIDGSNATIVTKEGDFIADRNRISRIWMDHGLWPYLTLCLYIHKTGDLNILLKNVTYFRDYQLARAKEIDYAFSQSDYLLRTRDNAIYEGSILEHLLIENLVQFFNVGEHNIIRLENADWNDGLDMAQLRGESVAFSFMYAHNLKNLCVILEKLKEKTRTVSLLKEVMLLLDSINLPINYSDYREKQKRLKDYFENTKAMSGKKVELKLDDIIADLTKKSEHLFKWLNDKEWLSLGFFNGYYDNCGRRVERKIKGCIRIMLQSQVFPIMSGGVKAERIQSIWQATKRYLQDKRLGGFRLNTNFGDLYLDLGRAFGFSYGDKENGAFFNHMVIMFAHSLYKQGFINEGYEVMQSVYNMATKQRACIYPMIPEYFNNQGKGLYHYLTASGSWYIYTLLEESLGIKGYFGDLLIEPKLLARNFYGQEIEVTLSWQKKRLKCLFILGSKHNKILKVRKLFLETKEILPEHARLLIKKEELRRINKKEINIRIYLK